MIRKSCIWCKATGLHTILDLNETPLADAFPKHPEEIQIWYPLGLVFCGNCKLVQLSYSVSDEELWEQDYGFYTGASTGHLPYWQKYAEDLATMFKDLRDEPLLEIACNDGTLLVELQKVGFTDIHGVDPAAGPAGVARSRGLNVHQEPFNRQTAQDKDPGSFALIVANNVLAHVEDPAGFLQGVADLLRPDGAAVFEVQHLGDLVAGNMFDHVYHEHRAFYSLPVLNRMIHETGMRIWHVQRSLAQGGSIRIFVDKCSRDPGRTVDLALMESQWLDRFEAYGGLQGRTDQIRSRLRGLVLDDLDQGRRVVGWGAAAKATTLMNFCGLTANMIDYIEDSTPAKIGRYMPGTMIPIIGPQMLYEPNTTVLVLAWNYAPMLLRNKLARFDGVQWVIPIPYPTRF